MKSVLLQLHGWQDSTIIDSDEGFSHFALDSLYCQFEDENNVFPKWARKQIKLKEDLMSLERQIASLEESLTNDVSNFESAKIAEKVQNLRTKKIIVIKNLKKLISGQNRQRRYRQRKKLNNQKLK